jgi:hypothetical protein
LSARAHRSQARAKDRGPEPSEATTEGDRSPACLAGTRGARRVRGCPRPRPS